MGSAAAMNASIKANAELRKRRRKLFHGKNGTLEIGQYNVTHLSKLENKKIRETRSKQILQDQYQKRVVGIIVLIPVLWFLNFLMAIFLSWI